MSQFSHDDEQIRRLMRIKSHETPPPGFHDALHSRIMAGIKTRPQEPTPSWWSRALELLTLRPALSASYALAACALVVCGFAFTLMLEKESTDIQLGGQTIAKPASAASAFAQEGLAAGDTNRPGANLPPPGLFNAADLRTQPASDRVR